MALVSRMLPILMRFSMLRRFSLLFNVGINHQILAVRQLVGGFFHIHLLVGLDQAGHREKCVDVEHVINETPFGIVFNSLPIVDVVVNCFMDLSLELLIVLV